MIHPENGPVSVRLLQNYPKPGKRYEGFVFVDGPFKSKKQVISQLNLRDIRTSFRPKGFK